MGLTKPKSTSFDFTTSKIGSTHLAADSVGTAELADLAVTVDKANLAGISYPGFEEDVALLGFKIAANGSLTKYNLLDQTVDIFEDASGIDAAASTNEVRNAAKYYSGQTSSAVTVSGNYDSTGVDGDYTWYK